MRTKRFFRVLAVSAFASLALSETRVFMTAIAAFAPRASRSRGSVRFSAPFNAATTVARKAADAGDGPLSAGSGRHAGDALIQLANEFMHKQSGFYSPHDEAAFSDEFVFRGPYIGPLNKEDYLKTMDVFGIYKAIPDISPNAFGWSVDPADPNRVWFLVRNTGTFTGEPGLGLGNGQNFPPNGASIQGCTETFSITFDGERKVKYLTVGYVSDRFEGNTAGKGAAVGIFNAIGLPFPSPGPLLSFAQWFGTEVVDGGPLSYSTGRIPGWWTSQDKASEGYL